MRALETAIDIAATPQQRIMAGFFVYLVHSAHRCSNGQRTRKLRLTTDALLGESLLKGKKSWSKWAASRRRFTRDDWAGPWVEQLADEGLPGVDFLVFATNVAMDKWLARSAEYPDFQRALHTLLMIYSREKPDTVVHFTPHGCRHVIVTAASQLAAEGILSDAAIECLGHWEKRFQDATSL